MIGHRLRHPREIDRAVAAGKQSVRAGALGPGALGDVVHIAVPTGQLQAVILNGTGDELAGVAASGGGEVVAVLEQFLAGREVPQELFYHLLLPVRSGQRALAGVDALHTLTGSDVVDVPLPLGGGALLLRLDVGTLEYDPGHGASPAVSTWWDRSTSANRQGLTDSLALQHRSLSGTKVHGRILR